MPRKFLGGKPTVGSTDTPVVIESRTITATAPVTIAGTTSADLSADRTIAVTAATTSAAGVVQLSDSTSTTGSTKAATETAVKSAYDLANAAIPKSLLDAKGDLIGASADNTPARIGPVGANGTALVADSTATPGVAWSTTINGTAIPSTKTLVVTTDADSANTPSKIVQRDSSGNFVAGRITGDSFVPATSTVPTNGMYLPAANTVALSTNTTERVRIASDGKVGIGLTPSYPLDVTSSDASAVVRFTNTNSSYAGDLILRYVQSGVEKGSFYLSARDNGDAWFQSANASGSLILQTNGPNGRFEISPAGLVGVNGAASGAQLQVVNSTAANVGVKVKGASSQSGNLEEWQNSAGTVLASVSSGGAIRSASATAGIGYATGAGDAQTQSTNKTTSVTSNAVTGNITLASGSLNANTATSFTLTNSAIASTDMVIVQHVSGGTVGAYFCTATPASGSATVYIRNVSASNLNEQPVLKFVVIKSVTS